MNPGKTTTGQKAGNKIMPFFWFVAIFLTILASKLWLIDLYGSALPWWDQWEAEAWGLYIPFFEKTLALKDLFAAHCEHRIFVSRVLFLFLLVLNGQWDASLSLTLNAFMAAGIGVTLSFLAWRLIGKRNIAAIGLFNTLVFALPFSWECTLLGFIANYFLIAFALLAVWFLLEAKLFSAKWLLGLFCALLSLVTMASGFCAAAAVLAVMLLRTIMRQAPGSAATSRLGKNIIAMIILSAVVTAGIILMTNVPGHAAFQPANALLFVAAFWQNLAWPNSDLPGTAFIVWLPVLVLFFAYIFRRIDKRNAAEFIIAFALWIALQDAALAFSRVGVIASRHMVFLCLSLPINFLALLLLVHEWPAKSFLRKCLPIIAIFWLCNAGYGLWKISDKMHLAEAAKFKQHLAQCEKNVQAFLQSDNIADLADKPLYDIPYPDPQALALVLRNPRIRAILPSCVAESNKPGPLSVLVAKLIPKGDKLLIIGLALLAVLTAVRFYQSLGTLEKRLLALRWADFRRILARAALVLAAAVLLFAASKLYVFWSPSGLKVTYFRGTNFEEKICSRTEPAVCRDYGNKAPAWRVPAENFSALWEGILWVPETGEYLFFSQNDDGLRLIIDGQNVIDNWRDQSWETSALGSKVHLAAGNHRIAVEHYNREGEAALRIKWCGGPIPPNTVLGKPYLRKRK